MTSISISRRTLIKHLGLGVSLVSLSATGVVHAATTSRTTLTPDEALQRLKEGNEHFVANDGVRQMDDASRRLEIARGQAPFAVLVGCSDSRVSPELLFGRGLGELFIVRVAGNTVDLAALGSVEYAVAELGVPLIVVLGHERCGAVAAAVAVVQENATFPGSIGEMVEPIIPAVLKAQNMEGDLLDNSVRENIRRVVDRLENSEAVLRDPIEAGRLKIVGARYDLEEGKVEFFT
ncbi:MAG: carbonic anhydrase [Pseudomonadota bacterium]|nr:carbonic anhydrase [Pseudomonadota bacterium]